MGADNNDETREREEEVVGGADCDGGVGEKRRGGR